MMTRVCCVAIAGLLLIGCGDTAVKHTEEDEHGHAHAADEPDQHPETEQGMVQIEPTMLRDLRVTTATVEARSEKDTATVLGQVGVNESAFAEVSAPIAGRISKLVVESGSVVRRGATLAAFESPTLGERRAALTRARAELEVAERSYERKQRLAEQRIVALREVTEAAAVLASAKATVDAAQSELAALGSGAESGSGASMDLRAPVSGVVLERRAVLGRFVEAGELLFRIGELSRVWVTVHAFERDAVRVNVGSTADVILPAFPGRDFAGTVTLVGSEVEATSRTLPVRIELANQDGLLKPGMSVTARLMVGVPGEPVLVVPAVSLQRLQNDWVVFIPRGETAFEARHVGRGRDLGTSVEVLSGLTAGETVVVDGAFLLKAEAEKASGGGEEHEH